MIYTALVSDGRKPVESQTRATATTAIDVALNVLGGVRDGTGPVETLRKSPPSVLRKLCESMGATYIKVRAEPGPHIC